MYADELIDSLDDENLADAVKVKGAMRAALQAWRLYPMTLLLRSVISAAAYDQVERGFVAGFVSAVEKLVPPPRR